MIRDLPCLLLQTLLLLAAFIPVFDASANSLSEQQLWHLGSPGVIFDGDGGEYGYSLSAGDFNGDGYLDLAVGDPSTPASGLTNQGGVHVMYGTGDGLTADNDQYLSRVLAFVPGDAQSGEELGFAQTAGDFNGDGYVDLAVGCPGRDLGTDDRAGEVLVFYGSAQRLSATGIQAWNQDSSGIESNPEDDEEFGWSLAAGDFNGDGIQDLAIGVPGQDIGATLSAGAVHVIYGSSAGLTSLGAQFWHQDVNGIPGMASVGGFFGDKLATGDFNGDGFIDLAVGVPGDSQTLPDAGSLTIIYGTAAGLSSFNAQVWSQNSFAIADQVESGDGFPESLCSGDFNGDGFDDLAVGVPGEDLDLFTDAGAVHILHGTSELLTDLGSQFWTQDLLPFQTREANDLFGRGLAAGDFNGDGYDDLVIGAYGEDSSAGMAVSIAGSAFGLTPTVSTPIWMQGSSIIDDTPETGDMFAYSMIAGDMDGDGIDDLAIGVPGEDIDTSNGAVHVLMSDMSRLIFSYVACNGGWDTEIGIVRTGGSSLDGQLKIYDAGGTLLEAMDISLAGRGRRSIALCSAFPDSAADTRYAVFESDSDAVAGYTTFSLAGTMRGAVPASESLPNSELVLPHVGYTDAWWTGLGLVNTPDLRRSRTLTFNTGDNATLTLAGRSQNSFSIDSLFTSPPAGTIQSARLEPAPGLVAMELFGSGVMLAGVRITDENASTLYYPHVAPGAGVWWTGLAAYNPAVSSNSLTITAYSENGTVLATLTDTLDPGGKLLNSVQGLGLPTTTAWVKIQGSQPLTGLELFGTADGKQLAGFTVTNFSRTSGVLPRIDTIGWTGLALVNTTDAPVSATLVAYDNAGAVVTSKTFPLAAHAKILGTPADLFAPEDTTGATYVAFTATGPVAAFQLNGSTDGMMLDALPGM